MTKKFEYTAHSFEIEITNSAIKRVGLEKFKGVLKSAFKIYIIKYRKEFIYIGHTKTYLSSRFSLGFKATLTVGNNGYHGYKWIKSHRGKKLDLIVFTFPNMIDKIDREIVETIEAELVFQVRTKYGRWPECQNEIHFFNKEKSLIKFSEKLFKEIC
ncbi:MAG: hypothetical protein ACJ77K_19175 [Bacteroidia bacterium]